MIKKVFCVFCTLILCLMACFSSLALSANNEILLNELRKGLDVNGSHIDLPVFYMNQAENYLNTDEVSDDEFNLALQYISEFRQLAQKRNADTLHKLKNDTVLTDRAIKMANDLDFTVIKDKEGYILIKNNNVAMVGQSSVIKTTGTDYRPIIYISLSLFFVIIISLVLFLKRKCSMNK